MRLYVRLVVWDGRVASVDAARSERFGTIATRLDVARKLPKKRP